MIHDLFFKSHTWRADVVEPNEDLSDDEHLELDDTFEERLEEPYKTKNYRTKKYIHQHTFDNTELRLSFSSRF